MGTGPGRCPQRWGTAAMPPDRAPDHELIFGDFTIVKADERVIGANGPIKLGRKAYQLLLMLVEQNGQLVTKDRLFATVWDGTIVSESALTSVVKELRRALDDPPTDPRYIESVYGRGYRLVASVEKRAVQSARALLADAPEDGIGDAPLLIMPPFEEDDMAGAPRQFGAMLREELLVALSRFREIRLVSDAPTHTAATAPGPRDYRLTMRLLHHGEAVQAFVRIARLATGAIVWAEQLSLPTGGAAARIEEVARRIAGTAMPRLRDDMLLTVPRRPRTGYDHYFANRLQMRDLDDVAEARRIAEAWESLIAAHPELVQAYPPLIRLYNTDFGFTGLGATGREERQRAYDLAHRAIALDPTDSHLHTVKGWCHLWADEPGLARRHFEEALRLNPSHHERLVEVATGFMFLDDLDRAHELLDRCRSLAVFASEVPQEEEGLLLLLRQDYAAAAEALALARWVHPDDRAKAQQSPLSGLYALLAMAGADKPELDRRAEDWRALVEQRWVGAEALTPSRLKEWAQFHNPFQNRERKLWLAGLIDRALASETARTDLSASPERSS